MDTIRNKLVKGMLIAEIGSVHDGSFGNAKTLIEAAAWAGADAVKFQIHIFSCESIAGAPNPPYFDGEDREKYFSRTAFSEDQWAHLKQFANEMGLIFIASPFSVEALALLERLNIPLHKIASGELTNLPLLSAVAQTGKPVLLSTGMSDWNEIEAAIDIFDKTDLVVPMQCTSLYPCPPERVGLNVIAEMTKRLNRPAGFSDHSLGTAMPIAAAALGVRVIEKHITLSRRMYGSDAAYATEPDEFKKMCADVRAIWASQDNPVDKDDLSEMKNMKRIFEKMIVAKEDLPAGIILKFEDLAFKKPCIGVRADRASELIGRRTSIEIKADQPLVEEMFE